MEKYKRIIQKNELKYQPQNGMENLIYVKYSI